MRKHMHRMGNLLLLTLLLTLFTRGTYATNSVKANDVGSFHYTNWAGNIEFDVPHYYEPSTIQEVQEIIRNSTHVRVVGTSHAANPQVKSDDTLISLTKLRDIITCCNNGIITVQAGVSFHDINPVIEKAGYALESLPCTPELNVLGTILTSSHGAGVTTPALPALVRDITIVAADGTLRTFGRADPEFPYVIASMGVFGVVVQYSLTLVPSYDIKQYVYEDVPFDSFISPYFSPYQYHFATGNNLTSFSQPRISLLDPTLPFSTPNLARHAAQASTLLRTPLTPLQAQSNLERVLSLGYSVSLFTVFEGAGARMQATRQADSHGFDMYSVPLEGMGEDARSESGIPDKYAAFFPDHGSFSHQTFRSEHANIDNPCPMVQYGLALLHGAKEQSGDTCINDRILVDMMRANKLYNSTHTFSHPIVHYCAALFSPLFLSSTNKRVDSTTERTASQRLRRAQRQLRLRRECERRHEQLYRKNMYPSQNLTVPREDEFLGEYPTGNLTGISSLSQCQLRRLARVSSDMNILTDYITITDLTAECFADNNCVQTDAATANSAAATSPAEELLKNIQSTHTAALHAGEEKNTKSKAKSSGARDSRTAAAPTPGHAIFRSGPQPSAGSAVAEAASRPVMAPNTPMSEDDSSVNELIEASANNLRAIIDDIPSTLYELAMERRKRIEEGLGEYNLFAHDEMEDLNNACYYINMDATENVYDRPAVDYSNQNYFLLGYRYPNYANMAGETVKAGNFPSSKEFFTRNPYFRDTWFPNTTYPDEFHSQREELDIQSYVQANQKYLPKIFHSGKSGFGFMPHAQEIVASSIWIKEYIAKNAPAKVSDKIPLPGDDEHLNILHQWGARRSLPIWGKPKNSANSEIKEFPSTPIIPGRPALNGNAYSRAAWLDRLPHFAPGFDDQNVHGSYDELQTEYSIPMNHASAVLSEIIYHPELQILPKLLHISEIRMIRGDSNPLSICYDPLIEIEENWTTRIHESGFSRTPEIPGEGKLSGMGADDVPLSPLPPSYIDTMSFSSSTDALSDRHHVPYTPLPATAQEHIAAARHARATKRDSTEAGDASEVPETEKPFSQRDLNAYTTPLGVTPRRGCLQLQFTWRKSQMHQLVRVLPHIEDIVFRHRGKPHWGKFNAMSADMRRATFALQDLGVFPQYLDEHNGPKSSLKHWINLALWHDWEKEGEEGRQYMRSVLEDKYDVNIPAEWEEDLLASPSHDALTALGKLATTYDPSRKFMPENLAKLLELNNGRTHKSFEPEAQEDRNPWTYSADTDMETSAIIEKLQKQYQDVASKEDLGNIAGWNNDGVNFPIGMIHLLRAHIPPSAEDKKEESAQAENQDTASSPVHEPEATEEAQEEAQEETPADTEEAATEETTETEEANESSEGASDDNNIITLVRTHPQPDIEVFAGIEDDVEIALAGVGDEEMEGYNEHTAIPGVSVRPVYADEVASENEEEIVEDNVEEATEDAAEEVVEEAAPENVADEVIPDGSALKDEL